MAAPHVEVRLVRPDDAPALASLVVRSREALAPWEPLHDAAYFTEAGQRSGIATALARQVRGEQHPFLVLVDGVPAGRMNLNDVVRGAFQNAHLGYWVDVDHQGRGVATAAVRAVLGLAFGELGLHRVQAGTLVHNHASRRVLAKNGFTEIGLAPGYLRIAGRWQDHVLHQRLADDRPWG
ncbi:[SSU ribosomal protein S5P]-alanine acetyltransferase [Microlunatus sagamiharensis]|uniref:[SSU ribosomal protein S5P]-alanine acetyltransferase n=1 Tax=Microlunatus sagamiharensis TaxID=546874 RepID=A0A1H2MS09_9ACTN|nr:GNAT family protein [Microlunatus sagamiharensis]SDU96043.1 [SSU ribosomal protein S5P]-alanine acetyltransferase [Microlunatus sagamiharensis]